MALILNLPLYYGLVRIAWAADLTWLQFVLIQELWECTP